MGKSLGQRWFEFKFDYWKRNLKKVDFTNKYYKLLEAEVPEYTLPEPLSFQDGRPVTNSNQWIKERRPEVLELFREHIYGRSPPPPAKLNWEVADHEPNALDGRATRKQVNIQLTKEKDGPTMSLLLYIPNFGPGEPRKSPAFLGLNFWANHTIHHDPGIHLNHKWSQAPKVPEKARGIRDYRWPVEMIVESGYALGTIYYGDILLDRNDGFASGMYPFYCESGQNERKMDDWGAISAWAWGLSRALDYLQQDPDVDPACVAVLGHSRLGKTALWAGAQDERFFAAISNDSGCGGAALSRRHFGETVQKINTNFPHWFCKRFREYNENEAALPVDQHLLVSLIAPRPVYVASAQRDVWADPKGEFLSAKFAGIVYELFGHQGLPVDEMPPKNTPVMSRVGYHMRTGRHNLTKYDWRQFIKFINLHREKQEQ